MEVACNNRSSHEGPLPTKSLIPEPAFEQNSSPKKLHSKLLGSILRLQDATAPQTGSTTGSPVIRLAWTLAYFGLFVVFLMQTVSLWNHFASNPTNVNIDIIAKPNLIFPG